MGKCLFWKDKHHKKKKKKKVINLHIVPHSHTDAGWIEPIDWYYKNFIVNIFSNIVEEMYNNKNITFVWADTNYLHQWYESQNQETQEKFQNIVKRGQLEFAGGGWVQNDESLSDLKSIINQMNVGLQYLHERFNATPTVGWQIDPFGYNHFMPSVFKELGYKYLVLNRIGDSRKEEFKNSSNMDFFLEPAKLGSKKSKILTHVLSRHYEPIDYDSLINSIPPLDAEVNTLKDFVKRFYDIYIKEQVKGYSTEEFMMLMGKDFGYGGSIGDLSRIDTLNKILTKYSKEVVGIEINSFFSLPSKYFEAIESSKKLKTYTYDFLNYDERLKYLHPFESEDKIDYWVGYYFTRPYFKKRINEAFHAFRSLAILTTFVKHIGKFNKELSKDYDEIEKQLSYMLHHDAITGTSREQTIEDYLSRIFKAELKINSLFTEMNSILLEGSKIASKDAENDGLYKRSLYYFNQAVYRRNITLQVQDTYTHVRVFDEETQKYLSSEIVRYDNGFNNLYFVIEIGGLTLKTITLEYSVITPIEHEAKLLEMKMFNETEFSTKYYTLKLKDNTLVDSLTSKASQQTIRVNQQFNKFANTRSGIYVFKPFEDKQQYEFVPKKAFVYQGDIVTVVRSTASEFLSQQITIFKKCDLNRAPLIETLVRASDVEEIGFTLDTSSLSDEQEFYNHDSNDFNKREFRKINGFNETGKNIYPVLHGYAVASKKTVFSLINNYPTGCGYIYNSKSEVQCFLIRNTDVDDDKGLPDRLEDAREVNFAYFLIIENSGSFYETYQPLSDYFHIPVTTKLVNDYPNAEPDYFYNLKSFSLLKNDLPTTLEVLDMFESYKGENFIRLRSRDSKDFFFNKEKNTKIQLKNTFSFDIEGDHKYMLHGLNNKPKKESKNIVKKSLKALQAGYHLFKDDIFKFE
jgi:hypothetical protein